MEKAIVTGASSGIGAAIALALVKAGYEVYGIGRDFRRHSELLENSLFHERICDLRRHADVTKEIEAVKEVAGHIHILVNCAGAGYFGPHEQISPDKLHSMVAVNIEAPMIITGLLLRDMKKNGGIIINISSVTAKKSNTYGCAYGATKAALTSFGASLFDEARKYGVKVVNIHPDMTESEFYRNADFTSCDEPDAKLYPSELAQCVMDILSMREGAVVTDITVRPQRHGIKRKVNKHTKDYNDLNEHIEHLKGTYVSFKQLFSC